MADGGGGGGAAEDVLKAKKTVLALCSELLHSLKMQQADEQRSFFLLGVNGPFVHAEVLLEPGPNARRRKEGSLPF